MSYLKRVWHACRALCLMIILNVVFVSLVSSGFTSYFPESNGLLDFAYQFGVLPSVWGLYGLLAGLLLLPFTLIPHAKWPLMVLIAFASGVLAVVLVIDGFIYEIYNYHINWFFVEAFFADEGGEFFDVSLKTYLLFSFAAVLVTVFELFLLWWVGFRLSKRDHYKWVGVAAGFVLFANVLFVNVVHSWAYAQNYMPITSISGHVPFYFPIHSRSIANSELLSSLASDQDEQESHIYYPRSPMVCLGPEEKKNVVMVVLESWRGDMMTSEISPNTYALAQDGLWFDDHHSNGTVTTTGIFSLMYGLVPTYLDLVVANNGAGGPVLINQFKQQDYRFGVFASGDIERIKIADTSFSPVKEVVEHGQGEDTIEKDRDVLNRMKNFVSESDEPFFGWMFFNSTHYLYYYPEEFEKFKPTSKPSLIDFKQGKNPEPYLNRYKNSIYFVDSLIQDLVDHLKKEGRWEDTILIITSDHAEEFADTQATRFGHGSNFTRYQTEVPLVIHWPGKEPQKFDYRTHSVDVSATLLTDYMNCENPATDFSNGESLFDTHARDVQVVSSYYNYAFVTDEGAFVQNPVGLPKAKDNDDKDAQGMRLKPELMIKTLDQMRWFKDAPKSKETPTE
ncbi:sulfatase-like hydrolase/transferase [Bermanella marisrubri]|nr:sulfatase-like hydrolase/transferase [Bermanella marisrubri]QIZ84142.1 sulfatase-like hydrolase/transferase [Bermanella marisrubri]